MAVLTDLEKLYKRIHDPDMWVMDYEKLVSRNALIYFIFGEKTLGKTYGATEYIWKHYQSTGRRFLFLRRRQDEWLANRTTMWVDYFAKNGIDKEVISEERYRIMIRDKKPDYISDEEWITPPWEVFGFSVSLDNVQALQGLHTDNYDVDTIFFDEFMLYNTQKRLIPDEAEALQTCIKNTFRNNTRKFSCKVLCASNAGFMTNPYFLAYNIKPKDFNHNTFVWRDKVLFVACPPSGNIDPFEHAYTQSFTDFANRSKFLDDTDNLIINPAPKGGRTVFAFEDENGNTFAIARIPGGDYFVKDKITAMTNRFTFDPIHIIPGAVYSKQAIDLTKRLIAGGKLFFESALTRNLFMENM